MGIWQNIRSFLQGSAVRQKGLQSGSPGAYQHAAALPVTPDTALQLSSTWACVRIIAETISSMPIRIYDVDRKGVKTLNTKHPLHIMFNGKMNKWQTRQEYFETITYQFALQGNNYSIKQFNNQNQIIGLVPLMTAQMEVDLLDQGTIEYTYTQDNRVDKFKPDEIWHNKLFGNGVIGLSPIGFARNSLGLGQAAELSTTNIYKNGGKPSGLLMIDKILKKDQRDAIKKNFAELSVGNDDRLFVLEADMKYQQVSLSPQDIELLASRRFQLEDICRFFGVPPVMVGDPSTTAWGSGIQQIIEGFFKFNLRPYLSRYEASMEANLLSPEERVKMKIEFDFTALLRPDRADRIKAGKEGVQGGLMTPNEFRKDEGLPPKEGGDSLIVQQQMVPLENIGGMDRTGSTTINTS